MHVHTHTHAYICSGDMGIGTLAAVKPKTLRNSQH